MPAFGDVELPAVEILPSWNTSKSTADSESQTDEISYTECASQSTATCEIETQTEADAAQLDEGVTFPTELQSWHPDGDVQSFVCRAAPDILAQLQQNISSHAFDDFDVLAEEQEEAVTKLHTLSYDFSFNSLPDSKKDQDIQLQVTGLSWNSTGSVLAVSYGRHDLSGWCDLPGALCTWNLFHRDFNPAVPNMVLDTSTCLMCVACHPEQPAIVAAGSFNGEVYVWNTGAEEQLLACTQIDDYFHREPIATVAWVYNIHSREYEVP
jgi:WD40 repeat protein